MRTYLIACKNEERRGVIFDFFSQGLVKLGAVVSKKRGTIQFKEATIHVVAARYLENFLMNGVCLSACLDTFGLPVREMTYTLSRMRGEGSHRVYSSAETIEFLKELHNS